MNISNRKDLCNEKVFDNAQEIIGIKNSQKLTLRKQKLNKQIQVKRDENLEYIKLDSKINIDPELKFRIDKFEKYYMKVLSYLNSNNSDLISYALYVFRIYICFHDLNVNEQKILIEYNFLNILLNLGYKSIDLKINDDLEQILLILINIQYFDEGNMEYLKILYSDKFFNFYYKILDFGYVYIRSILWIINNLIINNDNIIFELLRSKVFSSILDYSEEQEKMDTEEKELILTIIDNAVNLSDYENILKEEDLKIIDKCFNLLIKYIYGSYQGRSLLLINQGLYYLSNLNNKFNYNEKIINEGATIKILINSKKISKINDDSITTLDYGLRIIANNLTLNDKDCEIIYSINIIDFYNNILLKFNNNFKILRDILAGLINISVGNNWELLKRSSIWEENYIQQYCCMSEELLLSYIKLTKYFIFKADYEVLKFIYNTKIIHFMIYLFTTNNLSQLINEKIIKLIDRYLKKFTKDKKESEEYSTIYHKFKDLLNLCDKINNLECQDCVEIIQNNIMNNYI